MSDRKDGAYKVGKGRPPQDTQFKPGQSGNPRGRPKKMTTYPEVLSKVLAKKVPFTDNDGVKRRITLEEATALALVTKAAKGQVGAMRLLSEERRRYGSPEAEKPNDGPPIADEEAALEAYLDRLSRKPNLEPGDDD